jgi:hypothetical protein
VHPGGALGAGAFDPFALTLPADSRLPASGAVLNLYDVKPAYFARFDNFVTFADNFGNQLNHYNGVDVTANARLPFALTVQGGFSSGRVMEDECDLVSKLPEIYIPASMSGTLSVLQSLGQWPQSYCHRETPLLTQVKGLATYTIPRVLVEISGTFQSKPYVGANFPTISSQSIAANAFVPGVQIASSLGRSLAGNAALATINFVEPGTLYGDRINQIDMRFAKLLRYGRTRTRIAVDIFNLFNRSTTDAYQQIYGTSWLFPTSILAARIAKVGVQFDF